MYKIKEPYTYRDVIKLIPKNMSKLFRTLEWVRCDICGKEAGQVFGLGSIFEFEEFLFIDNICGYGASAEKTNNLFYDGIHYKTEICQECLAKLLGPYMRIKDVDAEAKYVEKIDEVEKGEISI